MQVLAWMWCITFAMIVGSWTVFGVSAPAHVFLLGATAVTVGTFETAKRKSTAFLNFRSGYTSYGRGRTYTIYRDKNGNAVKVPLDPKRSRWRTRIKLVLRRSGPEAPLRCENTGSSDYGFLTGGLPQR